MFFRLQSSVIYYLVLQVFVVFTALIEVHRNKYGFALSEGSWSAHLSSIFERLGIYYWILSFGCYAQYFFSNLHANTESETHIQITNLVSAVLLKIKQTFEQLLDIMYDWIFVLFITW